MAMYIVKPWYRKKDDAIYGAEWAGTSDPSWVRTDAAVGFADPNPYYSGMSTTPSSPFDNIMPWAGMRRVTDASAGELVEIPKFYYKWTRDGVKNKIRIANKYKPGFSISPLHVDRGDGVGERDYAYVGRYVCSNSNYKSLTGQTPKNYNTRSQFVSGIHSLGTYVHIWDWLTYCTICMLYLVEYATFNSQAVIGYGCSVNNSRMSTGYTDSLPYHTGTTQSSRTSYGGTQYRYIEGIWDNIGQYFGGVNTPNSNEFWIEKNPNNFADGSVGIKLGSISYGYNSLPRNLKLFNYPGLEGLFWFEDYVDYESTSGASNMYTCDKQGGYGPQAPRTGTVYSQEQGAGLFDIYANYWNGAYSSDPNIGSRLMVLPPSRLSA